MLVAAHSQRDRRKLERENPCSSLGRMAESWDTEFESPIPLPSGAELVSLRDAIEYIRCLPESAREHEFWPDSVSLLDRTRVRWNHVQGYRQITDVYLLALAVANQGRLATFDSSISLKAVEGAQPQNLDLIAA